MVFGESRRLAPWSIRCARFLWECLTNRTVNGFQPRHIARSSVPTSRTTRSCTLHIKAHASYQTGATTVLRIGHVVTSFLNYLWQRDSMGQLTQNAVSARSGQYMSKNFDAGKSEHLPAAREG
jgi:hypothetical protein